MLIAEEFLLLCLDDDAGTRLLSGEKIDPALGGAVLAELVLLNRVGITTETDRWGRRGRVSVISAEPTGDSELDSALRSIAASGGKRAKDLISSMSFRRITKGLRDRLLARLAAAGVLSRQADTVLAFIPRTVWPTVDPTPEQEVRRRLHSALVDGLTPNERTVILICLLQATGHLAKVVPTEDRKLLKARAKALSEGEWAAKAVKQAIDEVYAATASVAVAGGIAASS
ncbi:MAG: hypothetical protein JWN06_3940 [Propionibacteriaceae bacterium]|jgi:hypothetical protein|nr:hypothetical protein [Propionibacteriaceae bacterium]